MRKWFKSLILFSVSVFTLGLFSLSFLSQNKSDGSLSQLLEPQIAYADHPISDPFDPGCCGCCAGM